ncbi:hypothetical protein ISN45_Aa03g018820 [Arabidopsis thaliana x Arabidopsis arenosa]|uniref:Uncharacterized protein n=2 Tax=Arabidopsis TaxID=3701 RepID=A0A8T2BEG5_ARASU|nr:hypothetical protein ISN45_Aa03g018820 [Arabidopsis thaliana x Arabidopsis arenosa]KAG7582321.1 hypothetical protein ISN44_As08g019280 [Arabidopsis suecica]
MGKSKKTSTFSVIRALLPCCSNSGDDWSDEGVIIRSRIMTSDEDGRLWIAEPGVDRRATSFIARFYENRVSDPNYKTLSP